MFTNHCFWANCLAAQYECFISHRNCFVKSEQSWFPLGWFSCAHLRVGRPSGRWAPCHVRIHTHPAPCCGLLGNHSFAMDFPTVALVFDPRKRSHSAPTFLGANINTPSIYTVVYASQTLIFISRLTSNDLVLLSRQNGNHNSDFTGLKRFIKHESDSYESFFPKVASWLGTRNRSLHFYSRVLLWR